MGVFANETEFLKNQIQAYPSLKSAFGESLTTALYENQITNQSSRRKICKNSLLMLPEVIYTVKDFYLLDEFNYKIERLKNAGLIDFWYYQFIDKSASGIKVEKHPEKLKLQHFQSCFHILLIGSFINFVIFVLELLLSKYQMSSK